MVLKTKALSANGNIFPLRTLPNIYLFPFWNEKQSFQGRWKYPPTHTQILMFIFCKKSVHCCSTLCFCSRYGFSLFLTAKLARQWSHTDCNNTRQLIKFCCKIISLRSKETMRTRTMLSVSLTRWLDHHWSSGSKHSHPLSVHSRNTGRVVVLQRTPIGWK